MAGEMNHDVFISFSFKDINKAMQVVNELLSRHGIRCWICTKEIDGGSSYKQDIVEAIMASKLTVLLWSKNAAASLDIPREIGIALEERKDVIPFLLDTTPFTHSLRYDLTGVQQTKGYGKSFSACIADLAEDIAKKLKGTNNTAAKQTGQQPAAVPPESKPASPAPVKQETQPATQPATPNIKYQLRNGGYTVTRVPDIETVVIPESVNGLPVVAIGEDAFEFRKKIRYVKLPASLRLLENNAFSACHGLKKLEIPEGVAIIGNACFSYCGELTEIYLPISLRKMGESAFSECNKLKRIEIPPNVDVIPSYCFNRCSQLTEVIFPNGLKEVGMFAFFDCHELRQVILPDGVVRVRGTAFAGCSPEAEFVVRENTATHRALERGGYFNVKEKFDILHPFSGPDRPKVKIIP